jgi:hypothetical protein
MSVLSKLSHAQNRRDEVPNQELARELAKSKNLAGIQEIAENLWHEDRKMQYDCIKVMYEVGYLEPELILPYRDDFIKLLSSRLNRMVWGAMTALTTIAQIGADHLFPHVAIIEKAMEGGSVITVDAGVMTLAGIASHNQDYNQVIFPFLLKHLRTCRSKDVPQHAEKSYIAVNPGNRADFIAVLTQRLAHLEGSRAKRVQKVIGMAENLQEE